MRLKVTECIEPGLTWLDFILAEASVASKAVDVGKKLSRAICFKLSCKFMPLSFHFF